eukprot:11166997-Lingulodinium_polyedra.AAC.1
MLPARVVRSSPKKGAGFRSHLAQVRGRGLVLACLRSRVWPRPCSPAHCREGGGATLGQWSCCRARRAARTGR